MKKRRETCPVLQGAVQIMIGVQGVDLDGRKPKTNDACAECFMWDADEQICIFKRRRDEK